jgi:hypothetical protein
VITSIIRHKTSVVAELVISSKEPMILGMNGEKTSFDSSGIFEINS